MRHHKGSINILLVNLSMWQWFNHIYFMWICLILNLKKIIVYNITYHPKKDLALVGRIFVKHCHNYNKVIKNYTKPKTCIESWILHESFFLNREFVTKYSYLNCEIKILRKIATKDIIDARWWFNILISYITRTTPYMTTN